MNVWDGEAHNAPWPPVSAQKAALAHHLHEERVAEERDQRRAQRDLLLGTLAAIAALAGLVLGLEAAFGGGLL